MGLMGALGSSAGGMILGLWGFTILNILSTAIVLGTLTVTLLRRPLRASLSTTERRNAGQAAQLRVAV